MLQYCQVEVAKVVLCNKSTPLYAKINGLDNKAPKREGTHMV